jgi:hypothetical protein
LDKPEMTDTDQAMNVETASTEVTGSDVAHWAWEAWGYAFAKWVDELPEDSDLHYADPYPDQYDAFFAAHPDGWPLHPDTPKELIGTYLVGDAQPPE